MDANETIIENQRKAFKGFMQQHKLNAFSWAKKSGVTEAAIRHYLSGRSQSLTSVILEKLAKSAGASVNDLIGGENIADNKQDSGKSFDRSLMVISLIDVEDFINKSNLKISPQEKAYISLAWYDLAQLLKKDGTNIQPEQFLADLIYKAN